MSDLILVEERGHAGLITLNRPKALNALSLEMVRALTSALLRWRDAPHIKLVAIRGMGKDKQGNFTPFGAFCAGGDIRFFHQAALAGDPALEDFFTEEYSLNHLIHTYPKPYVAFMDGINMGGGMGLSQGKALAAPMKWPDEGANRASPVARAAMADEAGGCIRIATERTKMAMPETTIGLFPDVGGGWFLSRCAHAQLGVGEYLALTGHVLQAHDALQLGLADVALKSDQLEALWNRLEHLPTQATDLLNAIKTVANNVDFTPAIGNFFLNSGSVMASGDMRSIITRLEASGHAPDRDTAAILRKRSPLMLHVVLEQIRRARSMCLADVLRMERNLVRHCFFARHLARSGAASETVEGIRALAVDKDHAPNWNPARIEDVTDAMWQGFFESPWPALAHPLAHL